MNLKQLDEHVENLDLKEMETKAKAKAATPEELQGKICDIYGKVRPVLDFLDSFWLLPKKWRQTINTLMVTLDQVCPQIPE